MHKETQENYLKAIVGLTGKNGKIRNIDLANALSVSKPTVTNALHQLEEDGCITFDKQNGILLTDAGREIAVYTLERQLSFAVDAACTFGVVTACNTAAAITKLETRCFSRSINIPPCYVS